MAKKANKILIPIGIAIIAVIGIAIFSFYQLQGKIGNKDEERISGKIEFICNRPEKKEQLEEMIKEFNEEYPDVTVKMELIGDVEEMLQRKATLAELPDVTLVPSTINREEYADFFLPLDDSGYKPEDFNNYYTGVSNDGKLYALNTSTVFNGVIYNKELFEQAGITSLPQTEEEFFEACQKLKDMGVMPVALNCRESWIMSMWIDTMPYLYNIQTEDELVETKVNVLDSDSSIYKGLNFAREIYKRGYAEADPSSYEWGQCQQDMIQGKTGMIILYSNFIQQLEDMGMEKGKLGAFPVPETNMVRMSGDYRIAVSKTTKYPKAAKAFLNFLMEDDHYADAVNITSSSKNSPKVKAMEEELRNNSSLEIFYAEDSDEGLDFSKDNEKSEETEETNDGEKLHDKYTHLKAEVELDYKFAQMFITCSDEEVQNMIASSNEKWKNYKQNNGWFDFSTVVPETPPAPENIGEQAPPAAPPENSGEASAEENSQPAEVPAETPAENPDEEVQEPEDKNNVHDSEHEINKN